MYTYIYIYIWHLSIWHLSICLVYAWYIYICILHIYLYTLYFIIYMLSRGFNFPHKKWVPPFVACPLDLFVFLRPLNIATMTWHHM